MSNLFTTPLATGVPFNWKDLTPVAMLALDQFVLWVNAESPYKNAKEYLAAVKEAGPGKFRWAVPDRSRKTRSSRSRSRKSAGVKFTYVPFKGGGDVAVQLVGKHVDSTVNNPIEAVAQWRAGKLRPLCVFDDTAHAVQDQSDRHHVVERYPDLQGIGRADGLRDAARHLHARRRQQGSRSTTTSTCSRRCAKRPEWKKFMEDGAFNQTFMTGPDYAKWVEKTEGTHRELMREAGFLAKP